MNNDKIEASELPPKPHTTYNGYSDGSEPLWTAEQMDDHARAAIAMHRAAAAKPECQYPHETAKCAGCGWEQAAAEPVPADLHAAILKILYESFQRGYSVERVHTAVMTAITATKPAASEAVGVPDALLGNLDTYWLTADGVADIFVKLSDVRRLAAPAAPTDAKPLPENWQVREAVNRKRGTVTNMISDAAVGEIMDAVRALKPVSPTDAGVRGQLEWTARIAPTAVIPYDHVTAKTPFGDILITWKGWKDSTSYTVEKHPIESFLFWNGDDLEDTKREAEKALFDAIRSLKSSPQAPKTEGSNDA